MDVAFLYGAVTWITWWGKAFRSGSAQGEQDGVRDSLLCVEVYMCSSDDPVPDRTVWYGADPVLGDA